MATQTTNRPARRTPVDLGALFPGRYISITSFKRDGTGVPTPVWAATDGARLCALTDRHSAKVKRIRHNPTVRVAPCRPGGKLRGTPIPAQAQVLTDEQDLELVQKLLLDRYKLSYRIVMLIYRIARRLRGKQSIADGAALVITLDTDSR